MGAFFIVSERCAYGHPTRPAMLNPTKARELFALVVGSAPSRLLSQVQVTEVFTTFDIDGDQRVSRPEFLTVWKTKGLGDDISANYIFGRADTNRDGFIDVSPDLDRVFQYFDLNGDGTVSEMEFVVEWVALSS